VVGRGEDFVEDDNRDFMAMQSIYMMLKTNYLSIFCIIFTLSVM